jgi:transcriptional regulator
MAKRWTEDEDQFILNLREEGFTYKEIASRLPDRSEAATKNRLATISSDNLRRRWTEEEKQKAFELKEAGHANKYIAKQLGRTSQAVSAFFNKHSTSYYTSLETDLERQHKNS